MKSSCTVLRFESWQCFEIFYVTNIWFWYRNCLVNDPVLGIVVHETYEKFNQAVSCCWVPVQPTDSASWYCVEVIFTKCLSFGIEENLEIKFPQKIQRFFQNSRPCDLNLYFHFLLIARINIEATERQQKEIIFHHK